MDEIHMSAFIKTLIEKSFLKLKSLWPIEEVNNILSPPNCDGFIQSLLVTMLLYQHQIIVNKMQTIQLFNHQNFLHHNPSLYVLLFIWLIKNCWFDKFPHRCSLFWCIFSEWFLCFERLLQVHHLTTNLSWAKMSTHFVSIKSPRMSACIWVLLSKEFYDIHIFA